MKVWVNYFVYMCTKLLRLTAVSLNEPGAAEIGRNFMPKDSDPQTLKLCRSCHNEKFMVACPHQDLHPL